MASGAKLGLAAFVGLAIGAFGGVLGGTVLGARAGANAIGANWADTEARNADETIEVLRKLRAKQTEQAIEGLETHLNRHVFGLMPAAREGLSLPDATMKHLDESAKKAKAYRTEHPQPESKDMLTKDVAAFLKE